ncbi:RHS repeat-associated core domain-containing protein [Streptomyces candidus]|uniref:RHS repeat-associated protein n=1 Tax=Streptomyces candidus TaxID=67283 RepID=A0A7X0HLE7_9ACTN|nr:RHS repeat-associated core domain-containing protein [Streptomyces candidus]MBB6439638.1 RHS repeat-associated protein [Streptomyces candidus]
MPEVKVGATKPATPAPEAKLSPERAQWRMAQEQRATATPGARRSVAAGAAVDEVALAAYVPEGQGKVPWHQSSDFRITDSLVASVNYSTGNLLLAGTDFAVGGVGQSITLARTYNSMDAPWGKVSQRWWQTYERYAQISDTEFVLYDSTGASWTFGKDAGGNFKTPAGYSKDLKENADYSFTLTDRKSGSKDTYNQYGTLTKVTDKNKGVITVDQHDEGGENKGFKVTETRSGRWVDLVKTNPSQWQAKDHMGRTAVFDLNPAGDLTKTTDTEGKATAFEYDTSRRLTKITTPEGRVTVFTYDAANRVTSMLRATQFNGAHTGPTYRYAYSATDPKAAGTTTVTDPETHATKYVHDAKGKVSKVTGPLNHSRSRTYDANNNVATATDAAGVGGPGGLGEVTEYGWDTKSNPTSATLPTGASSTAGYQSIAGIELPNTMKNADDQTTTMKYDTAGNTLSVATEGTGGGNQSFEYNKATPTCGGFEGQRCKAITKLTATKSVNTSFTYDSKGNLVKATPPAPLGATTYTYDALGRTAMTTDGRGIQSIYTYDNRDRIREVSTTNTTVTYLYDGDGNLKQRVDDIGTIKYDFDPLSRETVRTLQDGSQTVLAYTPAGNVDTFRDPSGTIDYTYDAANNLKSLKDQAGRTTSYEYNNNDVRTKTTYPGGTVQAMTPDASGRPKAIKATSPKGTLTSLTYTYAYGTGKDGSKIRTSADAVSGMKTTYSYDTEGRSSYTKEEKGTTLNSSWQYCYDLAGNLTSQGVDPGCPRGTTYTYNDAQQVTSKNGSTANWSYDKEGHELAGASTPEGTRTGGTWSDFSQLTSTTVGGKTYAGEYGSTDSSERHRLGDTYFHHGPIGLAAETTAGVDTGFVREAQGTLNSMTRAGKAYYYLTDALGSVVALADDTGTKVNTYSYSPRGVNRTITEKTGVSQPYRFAGGHQDPTGMYHLGARYYDPNIGRFTSQDPSGQEQNPYLYAAGDPVNHIDPSGLAFLGLDKKGWGNALGIAGTVVGAAALAPVGGVGLAVGAAALSTGLGVAGGVLEGDSAGQIAATGILSAASGGTGVAMKAAGVAGKTGFATDAAYEVGSYVGGAAIGGWDWT